MFFHRRRTRRRGSVSAFTLIEIIVIMAVVGILLSITILGFGYWRTNVARTELNSDLLNVKAGMEDARNRNSAYPTFTAGTEFNGTNSTKTIFKQSKNVTIRYRSGNANTYCIDAQSNSVSSVTMYINMASTNKNPQNGLC